MKMVQIKKCYQMSQISLNALIQQQERKQQHTERQHNQNERHSLTSDEDHYVMRPENVEIPM